MKDKNKRIIVIISVLIIFGIVSLSYAISNKEYKDNKINKENTINNKKEVDIVAAYIKQEDGTYKASSEIPNSGYTINKEKSICTNGAIPSWDINNNKLILSNLTKGGTNCYLYFDKMSASDKILANVEVKEGTTEFTGIAIDTDTGVFTGTDNDGTTYYYRGAVTNNYLKFANKWWRIIRINGDGSIRLIYDGTAYHANGTSTSDSIAVANTAFNASYNDNAYVGFMYGSTGASTYEATHTNTNKSTILTSLETWYTNNLASYASKIDTNAGFCGDRSINTGSTSWWSSDTKKGFGTNATAYGPFSRILNSSGNYNSTQTPTFKCPNANDLYTVKGANKGNKALDKPIGLITVDEVIYAGGFGGTNNTSYYLRNGNVYWTMSPSYFDGSRAYVFLVNSDGYLSAVSCVNYTYGVRPVINLKADVAITGSGTQNDPFVVNS